MAKGQGNGLLVLNNNVILSIILRNVGGMERRNLSAVCTALFKTTSFLPQEFHIVRPHLSTRNGPVSTLFIGWSRFLFIGDVSANVEKVASGIKNLNWLDPCLEKSSYPVDGFPSLEKLAIRESRKKDVLGEESMLLAFPKCPCLESLTVLVRHQTCYTALFESVASSLKVLKLESWFRGAWLKEVVMCLRLESLIFTYDFGPPIHDLQHLTALRQSRLQYCSVVYG